MSNSLRPHGLQHARLPCPSLSPKLCSNPCPLNQWCYLTTSATPFSFCYQSFPASGSFPVSQLSKSGGQSIGTSASASILPMNIQGWFPWGLTGWISLQSKGFSKVFSSTIVQKHQFFGAQQKNLVQLSHPYMTTGKNIALTICTFVGNILTLFFNMLSRFVIAFLPGSKGLLIPWLQSPSTVILEPKKIKCVTASTFSIYLPWSDGTRCHDLSFLDVGF